MWAARDEDGSLYLFDTKPSKDKDSKQWGLNCCSSVNNDYYHINDKLLPEVTWDDGAVKVEINIINENKATKEKTSPNVENNNEDLFI